MTIMRAGELRITDSVNGGAHILELAGELDIATAGELEAKIKQVCLDGAGEVLLDLDQLMFVDSTGLRYLIAARALCEQSGCRFALMHARAPVDRLFELTGLAQKLPFRDEQLAD
jgi:anti-anti-sigma factor